MNNIIVTSEDMLKAKVGLLKEMHNIILNMNDERYYYQWIELGVPDEPMEYDFEGIAEDSDRWLEILELFGKLTKNNDMDDYD